MSALESQIERTLVRLVRDAGGITFKFNSVGNDGVPDRIVIMPGGRIYFVELKTVTGRPSKLQIAQGSKLRRLGCDFRILFGEMDVRKFVEEVSTA